jgi:hypothetical protein
VINPSQYRYSRRQGSTVAACGNVKKRARCSRPTKESITYRERPKKGSSSSLSVTAIRVAGAIMDAEYPQQIGGRDTIGVVDAQHAARELARAGKLVGVGSSESERAGGSAEIDDSRQSEKLSTAENPPMKIRVRVPVTPRTGWDAWIVWLDSRAVLVVSGRT